MVGKGLRYILALAFIVTFSSCERRGCMKDAACVDNYDPRATKEGDCLGCNIPGAFNYCPEASLNNGQCLFIRQFYANDGTEGWIDVWVSDSAYASDIGFLAYEGRISQFPSGIPDCEQTDSTLMVLRPAGDYYFEVETQSGRLYSGWVVYREEACRLWDLD